MFKNIHYVHCHFKQYIIIVPDGLLNITTIRNSFDLDLCQSKTIMN